MSLVATLALPRWRRVPGGTLLGAAALVGIILSALLAGVLAPHDPHAASGTPIETPSVQHRLGTNDLGQDLLSIWLHGARVSLTVGFLAAAFSTVASGMVGLLSVTWRAGRMPLLALTDGLLAIPHLPIIVLIVALLGPGIAHLIAALALLGWPAYARVIRAQGLVAVQRDYVEAARALGASDARILRTCLLPEILPLLWTKFLLTVRWAILMEAALALMGLGGPHTAQLGHDAEQCLRVSPPLPGRRLAVVGLPPGPGRCGHCYGPLGHRAGFRGLAQSRRSRGMANALKRRSTLTAPEMMATTPMRTLRMITELVGAQSGLEAPLCSDIREARAMIETTVPSNS